MTGNVTGNITGNVTGIADEAVTLQTSRNFEITGDVTATAVGFDGSANVTLATSLSSTFSANTTGTIQAASFIKTSGTSSQFLKADGSSDSTAYIDLADLSVSTTVAGTAALVYNNLTGVFTYDTTRSQFLPNFLYRDSNSLMMFLLWAIPVLKV